MAIDFKTDQIRLSRLVVSGVLVIHDDAVTTDNFGGINISAFDKDLSIGADTFIFVSGTINSKGTATRGTTSFGGDTIVSGSLTTSNITGSLTSLIDGTSYIAGSGSIMITTTSSGQINIFAPPIPPAPPDGMTSFRHAGSGSGHSVWYMANTSRVSPAGTTNKSLAAKTLYAVPFIAPAGGGTIDAIGAKTNATLNSTYSFGIYENTTYNNLYPTTLMGSTTIFAAVTANVSSAFSPTITIEGGKLYWAVCFANVITNIGGTGAATCGTLLGWPEDATRWASGQPCDNNLFLTWTLDYGNVLPSTFPPTGSGARAVCTNATMPSLFLHYV